MTRVKELGEDMSQAISRWHSPTAPWLVAHGLREEFMHAELLPLY